MKPYKNYKDSNIKWIGKIPSNWEIKRLKQILKEPLKYGANESANEENRDNPRYIRITDFGPNGKLKDDTFKSLPYEIAQDYLLEEGDLLFARSGATVGKTFLFSGYKKAACYAGYLIKASVDKNRLSSKFLSYLVKSNYYENWKYSIINQATIQNIGADKYNNLYIPLPSTKEETIYISNYLDKKTKEIDDLIEKKEKLITLYGQEIEVTVNQAITKGLDLNVTMKDSGIEWVGKIPSDWEVKRIDSISESITGFAFKSEQFSYDEGVKLVRGDNVTEGRLRWGDKTRLWKGETNSLNNFFIKENDILIGMDGSKVGKNFARVRKEELPLLLVQRVARVRAVNEYISRWIEYSISSYDFRYFINLSKTDPAIPHITLKNIRDYKVFLPPEGELSSILEKLDMIISDLKNLKSKTEKEIELLKEYKTALISEVVLGKVDIREEVMV